MKINFTLRLIDLLSPSFFRKTMYSPYCDRGTRQEHSGGAAW